jgi:hypothetical protein
MFFINLKQFLVSLLWFAQISVKMTTTYKHTENIITKVLFQLWQISQECGKPVYYVILPHSCSGVGTILVGGKKMKWHE